MALEVLANSQGHHAGASVSKCRLRRVLGRDDQHSICRCHSSTIQVLHEAKAGSLLCDSAVAVALGLQASPAGLSPGNCRLLCPYRIHVCTHFNTLVRHGMSGAAEPLVTDGRHVSVCLAGNFTTRRSGNFHLTDSMRSTGTHDRHTTKPCGPPTCFENALPWRNTTLLAASWVYSTCLTSWSGELSASTTVLSRLYPLSV